MAISLSSTCILTHIAYGIYHSYKLQAELSKEVSKRFLRHYVAFMVGPPVFVFFLMMLYNTVTDSSKYTILPNGYCADPNNGTYKTASLANAIVAINKVAHFVIFGVYLYYTYKLKQNNIDQQLLWK